MNNTTANETVNAELDSKQIPVKEVVIPVALGLGLAAAVIGAREIYKRRVRKEVPLADGEE